MDESRRYFGSGRSHKGPVAHQIQHHSQTYLSSLPILQMRWSHKNRLPMPEPFLPTRGLPCLQTPSAQQNGVFPAQLSPFSRSTWNLFHVCAPVDSGVKQQNLNKELPAKRHHCLPTDSEMICRSHANEPMALLTNLIHLDVALRKNLMETPAMNTERIVPLVVFHSFCVCYQF